MSSKARLWLVVSTQPPFRICGNIIVNIIVLLLLLLLLLLLVTITTISLYLAAGRVRRLYLVTSTRVSFRISSVLSKTKRQRDLTSSSMSLLPSVPKSSGTIPSAA
jgi:hypothetical protein